MTGPIALVIGPWPDVTVEELARLASSWGCDRRESDCWTDHLDVHGAGGEDPFARDLLDRHGLRVITVADDLHRQALRDPPPTPGAGSCCSHPSTATATPAVIA